MHTSAFESNLRTGGAPRLPILFRAFVSLPRQLCQRDNPQQERTVFFEAEYDYVQRSNVGAARALEQLLALAWGVDTTGWCEDGFIYNIRRERNLLEDAYGEDSDGDARLLEIGCGQGATTYAQAADVDMFVTPRNRARLDAALNATAALNGGQHQLACAAAPRRADRTPTNSDSPSTAWPREHVPKKAKALPRQRQSLL